MSSILFVFLPMFKLAKQQLTRATKKEKKKKRSFFNDTRFRNGPKRKLWVDRTHRYRQRRVCMVLESAMQNHRERVERGVSVHASVSVCVCVCGGGGGGQWGWRQKGIRLFTYAYISRLRHVVAQLK